MTCTECQMPATEMTYIRSAEASDFDGLNMAGGMPDAICCEVTL